MGAEEVNGRIASLPDRKRPAHLPPLDMGFRSIIVSVTVCTHDRKPILARDDIHSLLKSTWAKCNGWRVGRYVIMPDHVHLFCGPGALEHPPLRNWVAMWKSLTASSWPRPAEGKVWQRDFWDRELRSGENYGEKWEYVRRNPVRAGLVAVPEDWLFQGELETLSWHDP